MRAKRARQNVEIERRIERAIKARCKACKTGCTVAKNDALVDR
jgi:hypothetical protein